MVHDHDHDHEDGREGHKHMRHQHHDHGVPGPDSEVALRVRAIESLLTKKKLIEPAALDRIIDFYENKIGPENGAKVVAKAWVDPAYREWLLRTGSEAIKSLGYIGRQGEHTVVLENTPGVHNMVVCTLCSCYPWPVLGLPPFWYKSKEYRARAITEPRVVLQEFGVDLPKTTKLKVWDSNSEMRYLVLPMRPSGTEGWTEDRLASLVTRNSMIGTGLAKNPDA